MRRATWMGGLLACSFCLVMAAAQSQRGATAPQSASPAQQPAKSAAPPQSAGEMKFQQNCSRCHNAPQELSPRISGTVVMHMRVRASLSAADMKAILNYLAP